MKSPCKLWEKYNIYVHNQIVPLATIVSNKFTQLPECFLRDMTCVLIMGLFLYYKFSDILKNELNVNIKIKIKNKKNQNNNIN